MKKALRFLMPIVLFAVAACSGIVRDDDETLVSANTALSLLSSGMITEAGIYHGPRIVLIDRNRRAYIVDKRDNDWVKVEDALIERSKVDPTFKCPYE